MKTTNSCKLCGESFTCHGDETLKYYSAHFRDKHPEELGRFYRIAQEWMKSVDELLKEADVR